MASIVESWKTMNGATASARARAVRQARNAFESGERSAGSTFGARPSPGRPTRPSVHRCRRPGSRDGRNQPVEEPRAAAPALATGGARPPGRPRQPQVTPRPGDPDVQQPPLLAELGRLGRLADRERALLERGQEDRVPLEALRAVIGQQLDAGRLAAGLDRGPPLHLGEERRDVGRGVRSDELLGQLEQGDDRPVTLARRLPVRDRVAPDTQLALERGRQPR